MRLVLMSLVAILIGAGVAIASSPGSLTRDHRSVVFSSPPVPTPTLQATPSASPSPAAKSSSPSTP